MSKSPSSLTHLALIGFAHVGKSTLGKLLAERWQWPWLDSDVAITASTGLSPAQWLTSAGEAIFREQERHWLKTAAFGPACLLSTGGGLPCYRDNLALLKERGFYTVYLRLDFAHLSPRLYAPPGHPLTRLYSPSELANLWAQRDALYTQADLQLAAQQSPAELAELLEAHLNSRF
ncbi:MAG: shikimate kinase [Candidatus Sericytochromatia bacterium]